MYPPRAFTDRISLTQACPWRPRAKHSTDPACAAVRILHGNQNSDGRNTALVSCLVPSSSPFKARTPACRDAYTPCLSLSLGDVVAFSRIPTAISLSYRSLTHAVSHTRCFSHTHLFTHARHFTHAMRAFQHAFCHTCKHTHWDNRTTTSAPGVSIPPKLLVYLFAALARSNSHGATEPTWSRSASRGHIPSPRS